MLTVVLNVFVYIDMAVILVLEDHTLELYIPIPEDRYAVRQFCRQHVENVQPTTCSQILSRKANLLERLRSKLSYRTDHSEQASEASADGRPCAPGCKNAVLGHSKGKAIAGRSERKIEMSWMNIDSTGKETLIRMNSGGGRRKLSVPLTANKYDLISLGKTTYF